MVGQNLEAILNGPALEPPGNVLPNFENPPHYNVSGYVLLCTFLTMGTLAIVIRFYTQIYRIKKVHIEDLLGLVGYAFLVAYIAHCLKVLASPGYYVHQWDVRVKDMSRLLYLFYICSNCYSHAIGCLKSAILVSWLRIFNPLRIHNVFWWSCQTLLWFNILYYIISAVVINFECSPHARIWDKTITEGYCIDSNALYLSGTIVNLVSDVAILLLPQKIIWGLHTSKMRKLGVSFVFGLGFLCIIVACFRVASTVALAKKTDVVYELAALSFWGSSEILLVLLVFCVPAFPKAFKRNDQHQDSKSSGLDKSRSDSLWKGNGTPWPRSNLSTTPQSVYKHIDEYSLEHLTQSGHSANRSVVASGPSECATRATLIAEVGIIRTAEFEASEHYASSFADGQHLHQYPWTRDEIQNMQ